MDKNLNSSVFIDVDVASTPLKIGVGVLATRYVGIGFKNIESALQVDRYMTTTLTSFGVSTIDASMLCDLPLFSRLKWLWVRSLSYIQPPLYLGISDDARIGITEVISELTVELQMYSEHEVVGDPNKLGIDTTVSMVVERGLQSSIEIGIEDETSYHELSKDVVRDLGLSFTRIGIEDSLSTHILFLEKSLSSYTEIGLIDYDDATLRIERNLSSSTEIGIDEVTTTEIIFDILLVSPLTQIGLIDYDDATLRIERNLSSSTEIGIDLSQHYSQLGIEESARSEDNKIGLICEFAHLKPNDELLSVNSTGQIELITLPEPGVLSLNNTPDIELITLPEPVVLSLNNTPDIELITSQKGTQQTFVTEFEGEVVFGQKSPIEESVSFDYTTFEIVFLEDDTLDPVEFNYLTPTDSIGATAYSVATSTDDLITIYQCVSDSTELSHIGNFIRIAINEGTNWEYIDLFKDYSNAIEYSLIQPTFGERNNGFFRDGLNNLHFVYQKTENGVDTIRYCRLTNNKDISSDSELALSNVANIILTSKSDTTNSPYIFFTDITTGETYKTKGNNNVMNSQGFHGTILSAYTDTSGYFHLLYNNAGTYKFRTNKNGGFVDHSITGVSEVYQVTMFDSKIVLLAKNTSNQLVILHKNYGGSPSSPWIEKVITTDTAVLPHMCTSYNDDILKIVNGGSSLTVYTITDVTSTVTTNQIATGDTYSYGIFNSSPQGDFIVAKGTEFISSSNTDSGWSTPVIIDEQT